MTNARAKEVLLGMRLEEFTVKCLYGGRRYMNVRLTEGEILASLDDPDFTADELEAIACWMRDPAGVVGA